MFSALKEKQAMEYPLVVKADTQGTIEAIVAAINKISTDEIKARVLHAGVGGITESDVTLAGASGAPIIGFNVRPNAKAREIADRQKVAFKYYDVIYELTDEIRAGMAGSSAPRLSKRSSAAPKSARSSRRASTARRRVCSLPKASSARRSRRASPATTSSSIRARSPRCAASRTTSPKCARASNAA